MADARTEPDPNQGVFETLLVVDGRPIELDAHLARLAASLETLFGSGAGADTRDLILDRARRLRLGRLRVTAVPEGDGRFEVGVVATEVEGKLVFPSRATALQRISVAGGLGPHKWADRAILERAAEGAPDGSIPLLIDRDGTVLEASRGNLFVARYGELATPPADGRILPGIARERALEIARAEGIEVHEEELTRDDLLHAEAAFLTGSLRGVEPVGSLDGIDLAQGGEITSRIAASLRGLWLIGAERASARSPVAAP